MFASNCSLRKSMNRWNTYLRLPNALSTTKSFFFCSQRSVIS